MIHVQFFIIHEHSQYIIFTACTFAKSCACSIIHIFCLSGTPSIRVQLSSPHKSMFALCFVRPTASVKLRATEAVPGF